MRKKLVYTGGLFVSLFWIACICVGSYRSQTVIQGSLEVAKTRSSETHTSVVEASSWSLGNYSTPPRLPVAPKFPSVPEHNTMPYPNYTKTPEDLRRQEWVHRLHDYLLTLNKSVSPQLSMVFGDHAHKVLFLNWMTAALKLEPPLHNILVMSLDDSLCEFARSKEFPVTCIESPVENVLNIDNKEAWISRMKVRLVVLRLINYWGYDVASYDTDAVLLKNPQVLYDERPNVHLFSAVAKYPPELGEVWGATLCAGTMLLRASPATEDFWGRRYHSTLAASEQRVVNVAVQDMNVTWNVQEPLSERCIIKEGWDGQGANGFTVRIIPTQKFCRGDCCTNELSRKELYIVHPNGSSKKLPKKEGVLKWLGCWFIKEHIQ